MTIANVNRDVALTTEYLNYPINCGISPNGYWYYYEPANALNTGIGTSIKPYQWGTPLPIFNSATFLVMEGSMPLITETWAGSPQKYHGGVIEWIGAGVNNITGTIESDAFFFAHLGALSASDDAFYWDRAYLAQGGSEWQYYQYHKHSPTNYQTFENGRQVNSGRGFIVPEDKSFGYQISTVATIMGTPYASVMGRIHTPSVGGAHNSHNDVTLPSVNNLNYLPCGVIRGSSNKYHVFYLRADGAQWKLLSRTYLSITGTFNAETDLGTYDFADPNFNTGTGQQSLYPFRASTGSLFGTTIFIPVVLNNPVSGFDLEVWGFPSINSLSASGLVRFPVETGVAVRPDMMLKQYGSKIFGAYTDVVNGGIRIKSFDGITETDEGLIVTNSPSNYLRIHGLEANPTDGKFYALLSGTAAGGGTYTGPGLYSFEVVGLFQGYKHLDFNTTNYSFVNRGPLTAGYIRYEHATYGYTRVNSIEPSGIAAGTGVLEYTFPQPKFINRKEASLGGDEYYYVGTQLKDGRKVLAGRITNNHDNLGIDGDFLVSFYIDAADEHDESDGGHAHHFAWGGAGDDYITGLWESSDNTKIWVTGYTKSTLVPRSEVKIHGWTRNTSDGTNQIEWKDLVTDTSGNIYLVGNHSDGYIVISKFTVDYEFVWQKKLDGIAIDTAHSIAIDSNNNLYIAGGTTSVGAGSEDAILVKFNSDGVLQWTKTYGLIGLEYASGIAITNKSGTQYIVISVISGTSTVFLTLDISGNILEQYTYTNTIVNRLRNDTNASTGGRFLFAGFDYVQDGETYSIVNQGLNNYLWTGGIYSSTADPSPVTLYRGATYTFNVNASGHPFWIKTAQVTGTGSAYNNGVTNNGTAVGTITFTVPLDAPSTLYYVCQIHIGMSGAFSVVDNVNISKFGMGEILHSTRMIQWVSTYNTTAVSSSAYELKPITSGQYAVVGDDSTFGYVLRVNVSEVAGVYTVTKAWASQIENSKFLGLTVNSSNEIIAVGYTTASGDVNMGMDDCLIAKYSSAGTMIWRNVYGHDMDERFVAIVNDITGENFITAGWSESHSFGRDGIFFRGSNIGFGTGYYHLENETALGYWYDVSTLAVTTNTSTLTNLTAPVNTPSSLSTQVQTYTPEDVGYTVSIYDGSYGPNGVFSFFLGYIDLNAVQIYLNSDQHRENEEEDNPLDYAPDIFTFWQVSTVGDNIADDGNIFGYDIIEHSDGHIYCVGATSGDLTMVNTGISGSYDYIVIKFDPITEELEIYQNGTSDDEEVYACCELADGRIAYVGRTTGNLASANEGGYDIFLGLFDPSTDTSTYYSIGSGVDDTAVNVHDLGNNELAVVYSTFGTIGNATSVGTGDIGVVKFNYSTNTWGDAYQTGSNVSEVFNQNGKPSVLTKDGRIGIVCSSTGVFADDAITFGLLDVCLGILDLSTGTWAKYQTGTGASDSGTTLFTDGDKLLIGGYSGATWADGETNAIYVEFDKQAGIGAKAQVESSE